jgi:hypothetical protein
VVASRRTATGEEISRPRHRPVVAEVRGVAALDRFVATRNSLTYEWREEAAANDL